MRNFGVKKSPCSFIKEFSLYYKEERLSRASQRSYRKEICGNVKIWRVDCDQYSEKNPYGRNKSNNSQSTLKEFPKKLIPTISKCKSTDIQGFPLKVHPNLKAIFPLDSKVFPTSGLNNGSLQIRI
jgi:hypothetical protein